MVTQRSMIYSWTKWNKRVRWNLKISENNWTFRMIDPWISEYLSNWIAKNRQNASMIPLKNLRCGRIELKGRCLVHRVWFSSEERRVFLQIPQHIDYGGIPFPADRMAGKFSSCMYPFSYGLEETSGNKNLLKHVLGRRMTCLGRMCQKVKHWLSKYREPAMTDEISNMKPWP